MIFMQPFDFFIYLKTNTITPINKRVKICSQIHIVNFIY